MTAGPFVMTNLEGLFSTFRHLESEMDELRTMRRVSQIWHEMERRERGAWTMFGRFFDRNMDDIHSVGPSAWGPSLFSRPRLGRYDDLSSSRDSFGRAENNVIVEFPTEDKEIKITLEEPSVVITEVEETSEPLVSEEPLISDISSPSPIRKSSLSTDSDITFESDTKPIYVSTNRDLTEETVNIIDLNNRTEKKMKKVDFSKMEVHFEPGSGKVNIVETNEKPPSNQLFRRKKRRSLRSESPKINVGPTRDYEFNSTLYEETFEQNSNSTIQLNSLQNNLDLSIINLRAGLFKNSFIDSSTPKSKMLRSPVGLRDANHTSMMNNTSQIKPPTKLSFRGSTKLQDMIQNSVNQEMKLVKTHVITKEVNSEKGINKNVRTNYTRQIPISINSSLGYNAGSKHSENIKLKPVSRTDSTKRNPRVARQESLKSTSSRGSSNGESRLCQRRSSSKDSLRRDSINKVQRTSSVGRSTTNSLKKGGIYVDGRPKKGKGSTVTLISYSNSPSVNSDRSYYNNVGIAKSNVRKVTRQGSIKTCSSRESICSLQNKNVSRATPTLKDTLGKKSSRAVDPIVPDSGLTSNSCSCKYATLKFSGRTYDSAAKDTPNRNLMVRKQSSFNSDSSNKVDKLGRNSASDLIKKTILDNDININKDVLQSDSKFTHRDSSLFKPIKKEKLVTSAVNRFTDIKTPVPIRKKSSYSDSKLSPSKENIYPKERSKAINTEANDGYIKFTKLNLASVKRSKEPLRSFEKISNGWVGAIARTHGSSKSRAEIKPFKEAENNLGERDKLDLMNGPRQIPSPLRLHQQREAMIRLSKGYPSRRPSSSYSKDNMETRKRSRNVYTPSSMSSNILTNKRRSNQFGTEVGTDSTPSEPVYETLDRSSRGTSSALVKRNRHTTNNCCNI